jgi:hypothetical protein
MTMGTTQMTFKYIARDGGEIIGRRTSAAQRVYTHAVVSYRSGAPRVVTWCGRLDLAKDELRRRSGPGYLIKIVPAERIDAYRHDVKVEA